MRGLQSGMRKLAQQGFTVLSARATTEEIVCFICHARVGWPLPEKEHCAGAAAAAVGALDRSLARARAASRAHLEKGAARQLEPKHPMCTVSIGGASSSKPNLQQLPKPSPQPTVVIVKCPSCEQPIGKCVGKYQGCLRGGRARFEAGRDGNAPIPAIQRVPGFSLRPRREPVVVMVDDNSEPV